MTTAFAGSDQRTAIATHAWAAGIGGFIVRQNLECAGLTALWVDLDESLRQSGVKPPHSKTTFRSRRVNSPDRPRALPRQPEFLPSSAASSDRRFPDN